MDRSMRDKKLNIAVIVSVMPSYRKGFYDHLFSRKDISVNVYCQNRIPGMNLKLIHNIYPDNVKLLKFFSAKREKISWQFIPWKEVLSDYDVVFIEGNPRNLSHALLASFMRLIGKNIVLWTMAHSFRGFAPTENLRLLWSRIFNYLYVYTDAEVDFLHKKGFSRNHIVGMNNGLDQKKIDSAIIMWPESRLKEWRIAHDIEKRILLLSCARLEPKNKLKQLVGALPEIISNFPKLIWCVIGDGVEKDELKSMLEIAGLVEYVRFVGELYNEEELAPWFLSSEIFVHPAAIGLSIMHAFGYGLPVVTHGNAEIHNPEYAAFEPELTGRNFHEDDIKDLSETVIKLLRDENARHKMRSYVQKIAREKYNVDVMAERFVQIAKIASNS